MLFLNLEFKVDEARFGRRHSELNMPRSAFYILTMTALYYAYIIQKPIAIDRNCISHLLLRQHRMRLPRL